MNTSKIAEVLDTTAMVSVGSGSESDKLETSESSTLWLAGPVVKISSWPRGSEMYRAKGMYDASVVIFLRTSSESEIDGDHPFSSIARTIARVMWHTPKMEALEKLSHADVLADRVCLAGLETHFVRAPMGETFSACRLAVAARNVGGARLVSVAALSMGDLLLVEGTLGYAAIARRSKEMPKAPMLWGA